MSGNLCRCGAHNGIIDAIRETMRNRDVGMTPFSYTRAGDMRRGRCGSGSDSAAANILAAAPTLSI